jgi:WD40 repeat protein
MNHIDLKTTALGGLLALGTALGHTDEADIYQVQFSDDGNYLLTGGNGGYTLAKSGDHTGGVKIWDSASGELIQAFGQRNDLDAIFGSDYGRVGNRRWGISNFKDVVLTGSYPDGKILLLPSSLGYMADRNDVRMPDRVGAQLDIDGETVRPIDFSKFTKIHGDCGTGSAFPDFVGPIVPSENGKYAGIVVNTCHAYRLDDGERRYEYRSDLHVMDLATLEVKRSFNWVDAGLYALGVSNDGARAAFVGRDRFAVLDVDTGEKHLIENYPAGDYVIPRQFSTLKFTSDGSKLVSLDNVYDIDSGKETPLQWVSTNTRKPRRISNIKIAPDLSFFSLVVPKRSLIVFGEDGLPRSYGKADKVLLLNAHTGELIELEVTDSMTEGKRCVTDISPDSRRVAVGCKGGVLRVYDARSGDIIWKHRNPGARDRDDEYIQALTEPLELAALPTGQ